MYIRYNKVYSLLSEILIRRDLDDYLNSFPAAVKKGAEMFAIHWEDYAYLSVTAQRQAFFEETYALFVSYDGQYPITLVKGKDFDLFELACLYLKCHDIAQVGAFIEIIHNTADDLKTDPTPHIEEFNRLIVKIEL